MIRVFGQMTDASGKGVAGAMIELRALKSSTEVLYGSVLTYKCDASGHYEFPLAIGAYDAYAQNDICGDMDYIGTAVVTADTNDGDLHHILVDGGINITPPMLDAAMEFALRAEKAATSAKSDRIQTGKDVIVTGQNKQVAETKAQESATSADEAKAARDSIVQDANEVRHNTQQVADNAASVASNTALVQRKAEQVAQSTQTVSTKALQVSENTQSVAANTQAVSLMRDEVVAKTSMVQAAADTATQKAASAAEHDAAAAEYARQAQEAAQATAGALMDGGAADLSAGVYPQAVVVSGTSRPTFWKVTKGGTVGGIDYGVGDTLIYTVAGSGSYYKIDNTESVTSVQGEKGAVTLTPEKIGAESAGTAAAIVQQHGEAPDPHRQYAKKTEVEPKGIASEKVNEHASKSGAHQISGVAGLRDELDKLARPVLSVEWVPKREAMWDGCVPADGQLLPRTLYPSALTAIQAGLVPVCTDAEWLADPTKRGCYTLGDGSTNFRLPDYNGRSEGSIGTPVFRGDGKNAPANGMVQGDCIREIQGRAVPKNSNGLWTLVGDFSGAFYPLAETAPVINYDGQTVTSSGGIGFAASRVVPTGPEVRMVNLGGCWAVRLFGAVQNVGSADAAALATAVATLTSRVTVLEARTSTCLVHATGTGAPHETVVTQLPSNIKNGMSYVLPNPFGNNVPVDCKAEIFVNGEWGETGWIYTTSGYGVRALYSQGKGIVVVTGGGYLAAGVNDGGNNLNIQSAITSAPCRVFVKKLEA